MAVDSVSVSAKRRIKVACVGNSITYGYKLADPATESYPAQLQKMLGDGYEVGNFGKSGATLLNKGHRPYMQQEEFRKAMDFAGDIVVIHLGINDTDPRDWPNYRDFFVRDYLSLIDSLRSVNPGCRVIIARLTPLSDRHFRFESGTRDWHEQIQPAIEDVARLSGAQLMDFHEPLYAYPYILHDAVHPDKEGAGFLAKTVFSAITGNFGGLQMPMVYSDNMVLQRGQPLKIQGIANAGEKVTVSIGRQKCSTLAGTDGKWSVVLQPLATGPSYTLSVSTPTRKLVYRNVLAGEVWLCSGQSNMEFYLQRATTGKEDIAKANCNDIRLFDMKENWRTDEFEWPLSALDSVNHLQYYKDTKWKVCSPKSVERFSAVAYYFGKMLRDSLKVPVGLICNAVGGSPTEAWIDRSTIESQFPAILRDWTKNDFIQDWVRKRAMVNMKKSEKKFQRHPYEPCYLYEAAIRPLQQFPVRGVIWYQGESNAHNLEAHEKLFTLLVQSWRKNWADDNLPFYFVQLSSLNRPSWTWFRDSQLKLMRNIHGTGMAVCSDIGDSLDVHPRNKRPVGERLARWALNKTYGKRALVPSGPLYNSAECDGQYVYLKFDYGKGLRPSGQGPIRTFEMAETEGMYQPATAEVVGEGMLRLYAPGIRHPRFVRYGWQPFTRANLVNGDGLPASTFHAELPEAPVALNHYEYMKNFPTQDKGFAKGVSACFAGIADGKLLVAGGCNFPKAPASEGGSKQFYRDIYAAELPAAADAAQPSADMPELKWSKVGQLPRGLAYGVAVSVAEGIVCIGGTDGESAQADVFCVSLDGKGKAKIESMPSLPCALDNMAGAVAGRTLYVVGGNKHGIPCNDAYSLDLDNTSAGWQKLPDFPGDPRTQPVCAALQDEGTATSLYLWGGFAAASNGRQATLSTDGYVYSSASGKWMPLPPPMVETHSAASDGSIAATHEDVSLGGGTAMALPGGVILCMGGVNKDIFLSALRQPMPGYMNHPAEWYRFNQHLLAYDTATGHWSDVAQMPEAARAGAVAVGCGNAVFYIGGELKPGVRTPSIVRFCFNAKR